MRRIRLWLRSCKDNRSNLAWDATEKKREEQHWVFRWTQTSSETLKTRSRVEGKSVTIITGTAEKCCSILVRSGWCSSRSRSRGNGRRWRRSSGGWAAQGRRCEEARGGKSENDSPVLFIKARDRCQARKSRSQNLEVRRSCRLDCRRTINEDDVTAVYWSMRRCGRRSFY